MRIAFVAAALSLCVAGQSVAAESDTRKHTEIAAQDLAPALRNLAKERGFQIVFATKDVGAMRTKSVGGELTLNEALREMLEGTGLTYRYIDDKTITIVTQSAAPTETSGVKPPAGSKPAASTGQTSAMLLAQAENTTPSSDTSPEAPTPGVGEIVITGTRLPTLAGEVSANPVFVWTQKDFERSGYNTLGEFRQMIPQLGVTTGIGGTGLTGGTLTSVASQARVNFDLRGLGNNTTLVLVDGRRLARGGQSLGADAFNPDGIPLSMVERIEVLTAGASALYGADAIGGVVNIILKKDFTGSEASVSYDNTFHDDAAVRILSAKTGYRAGGFSILASGMWSDNNEQKLADRWFTKPANRGIFGGSGFSVGGGTGNVGVRFGTLPGLGTASVAIPSGADGKTPTVSDYQNSGAPAPPFDLSPLVSAINPGVRKNAIVRSEYKWGPAAQLFLDLNFSDTKTTFTDRPLRASGLTIPAGYAGNPFGVPIVLNKMFFDVPRSIRESTNRSYGTTLGLQGEIPHGWNYELAASWARTRVADTYPNDVGSSFNLGALFTAMNDPDPSRRPILIYDSATGNPNPSGLLESLTNVQLFRDTADTYDYSLQFTGPTFDLPAGPISVAAGLEYRVDQVGFRRTEDAFFLQQSPRRWVRSAFVEAQIPIFSKANALPLAQQLELNLAGRIDDHNDFGSAKTPRVSLLYRPVTWLALRGSRSEGFKAPTLYSLYAPLSPFDDFFDEFNPLFDPVRNELVNGPVTLLFGGDPTLRPERSVTYNWGVVLDVPFVQGLSLSVDHYKIDYRDKVEDLLAVTPQLLVDSYPDRVTRAPTSDGSPGVIIAVDGTSLNSSSTHTRGYDLQLEYRHDIPWGALAVKAAMTNPQRYTYQVAPSDIPAVLQYPKRVSGAVTFIRHAFEVSMASAYQGKYVISPTQGYVAPSKIEWTPTLSYDFGRDARFGDNRPGWLARLLTNMKLSGSFPNVFNREPTRDDAKNSFVTVYDPRLARYIITLRKEF